MSARGVALVEDTSQIVVDRDLNQLVGFLLHQLYPVAVVLRPLEGQDVAGPLRRVQHQDKIRL